MPATTSPPRYRSRPRQLGVALLLTVGIFSVRPAAAFSVGGVGASTPAGYALQPGDSAAVAAVVERFHAAVAAGDSSTVLQLLADDAVVLESGGMETRAEFRTHHLPADIAFARAVHSERGAVGVTVAGDAAWAWSTSTTHGTYSDRPVDSANAELMVLARTPAGWRIRAVHWSSRSRRRP